MATSTYDIKSPKSPGDLLDLNQYPITDTIGAKYKALVADCRQQLKDVGACELTGFLKPEAVKAMVEEAEGLAREAYHSTVEGNAYLEPIDQTLPADHAKRKVDTTALGVVAYDQFPETSLLRRLYEWQPLVDFLADALGEPKLYRYADPMGALNLSIMKDKDYLRWHFDQTDFVTSIALQSSEAGGEFEFVPRIRSQTEENFSAVNALLQGSPEGVCQIPMTPGTLLLFQGRYSIHRVTHIKGPKLRHVALLGYDTKPGVMSSEHLHYMRYGRTVKKA